MKQINFYHAWVAESGCSGGTSGRMLSGEGMPKCAPRAPLQAFRKQLHDGSLSTCRHTMEKLKSSLDFWHRALRRSRPVCRRNMQDANPIRGSDTDAATQAAACARTGATCRSVCLRPLG